MLHMCHQSHCPFGPLSYLKLLRLKLTEPGLPEGLDLFLVKTVCASRMSFNPFRDGWNSWRYVHNSKAVLTLRIIHIHIHIQNTHNHCSLLEVDSNFIAKWQSLWLFTTSLRRSYLKGDVLYYDVDNCFWAEVYWIYFRIMIP